MNNKKRYLFGLLITVPVVLTSGCLFAAHQVYKQINNHREEQGLDLGERAAPIDTSTLQAGMRVIKDVAYGSDRLQRFDVYAPDKAENAPVILMVHGGGWFRGDKTMRGVVENKVRRWVPRGFVVISVNNRLVPAADPVEQARDVARALAKAQHDAGEWGGSKSKFILMGHSAGAHIVALVNASPTIAREANAGPWLGSVLLDSGALDVPGIMQSPHFRLYDRAFGKDPALWRAASPQDLLAQSTPPILAVCSSRRRNSCEEANRFVAKATSLGSRASVLPEDLTHGEINQRLGTEGPYTEAVENFLNSLNPIMAGTTVRSER